MSAPGWSRAPANGAPSRYAADLDLKVAGGRSAAALPHWRPHSAPDVANLAKTFKALPRNPKSVTHVLNPTCYLCSDCAVPWNFRL